MEFARSADEVGAITDAAISEAEALLAAVVAADPPTVDDVLLPLDLIADVLVRADGAAGFMGYVHPDAAVRDAARDAGQRVEQWSLDMAFREDLHAAVAALAATPEAAALEGEHARMLRFVQRDLRRAGHELSVEDRAELQRLRGRLVEIGVAFQRNVAEHEDALAVRPEDLDGLPQHYVDGLGDGPDAGTLLVTMAYPDVVPFLELAERRDLREELARRFRNRAAEENRPLLAEAVRLRARIAALFGHPSWAHHVLEERMADGPEEVAAFYERIVPPLRAAGREELATLRAMLAEDVGDPDAEVQQYDWRYYHTRLLREQHGVDGEQVAAHLPLERVLDGLLAITGEVFGIEHVPVELPTWHEDVRSFEVHDADDGRHVATVHMDLFPREGTFSHAAAFTLVPGRALPDGGHQRPVSAIVCNFTRPTDERPSLLTHDEVQTLFHEYGHVLHQVLTTAELVRFSGTSVERDFVEAPSQIMEHWTWDPAVLARFARHHETDESIPAALVERMVAARDVDAALQKLRQVQFGRLDLRLHGPDATGLDLDQVDREAAADGLLPHHEGTFFLGSFAHLLGGYDAGYYGYLWAEAIGDDMFTRFATEGVTSPEVGADYRREVLAVGGTRDAEDTVRAFLGRERETAAFLAKLGIAVA